MMVALLCLAVELVILIPAVYFTWRQGPAIPKDPPEVRRSEDERG